MRLVEGSVFLILAVSAHLALAALRNPDGEQAAAGAGGEASITLAGSTASLAAMVEDWKRPPEISTETELAEIPEPDLTETSLAAPETAPVMPPSTQIATPDAATPSIPATPPLPEALSVPAIELPELALLSEPEPIAPAPPQPTEPQPDRPLPPRADPPLIPPSAEPPPQVAPPPPPPPTRSELAPERAERPLPRPEPQPEPMQQAEQADRNSTASEAQQQVTAAGSGGGSRAGASGGAERSTLSQGQRASLMASWKSAIQTSAQRKLVYPRKAQQQGMRGRAIVLVRLDVSGRLLAASLAESSGNSLLDRAALQTMERVGRFPTAPEGLTGQQTFRIPVRF